MPSLNKISAELGTSRRTLQRWAKEPDFPAAGTLREIYDWAKGTHPKAWERMTPPERDKLPSPPAGGSGEVQSTAATHAGRLREQKLQAEIDKLHLQTIKGREKIIEDIYDQLQSETRKFLAGLKKAIKKCELPPKHARALNREINRCCKDLESLIG